jgi:hypothetical protein
VGNAREAQRRFEIFEGLDKILWKREPHRGVGPDYFSVFKELGATVWGSAEDLGPIMEPVLPKGTNFCNRSVSWGNCWVPKGQPSSSAWRGIREERLVEMWFPDQIFGSLMGGGLLLRGLPRFSRLSRPNGNQFLLEWKASSNGQYRNLAAAFVGTLERWCLGTRHHRGFASKIGAQYRRSLAISLGCLVHLHLLGHGVPPSGRR